MGVPAHESHGHPRRGPSDSPVETAQDREQHGQDGRATHGQDARATGKADSGAACESAGRLAVDGLACLKRQAAKA